MSLTGHRGAEPLPSAALAILHTLLLCEGPPGGVEVALSYACVAISASVWPGSLSKPLIKGTLESGAAPSMLSLTYRGTEWPSVAQSGEREQQGPY